MFQFLRQLWHRLCARLRFCGGVQYLAEIGRAHV